MKCSASHLRTIAVIFSVVLFTGGAVAEETIPPSDELHRRPVIVHRKGHSAYLTADAKLVAVGEAAMLVFLVEPIGGPSKYDWVPLSQIDHFSVYSSIEDAISDYQQSDEIKSFARERFQARWSRKAEVATPATNDE